MNTPSKSTVPVRRHARQHARQHAPRVCDTVDMALTEESADQNCIRELISLSERSARRVDDGMNAIEASEEQHAAAEAQAMC